MIMCQIGDHGSEKKKSTSSGPGGSRMAGI